MEPTALATRHGTVDVRSRMHGGARSGPKHDTAQAQANAGGADSCCIDACAGVHVHTVLSARTRVLCRCRALILAPLQVLQRQLLVRFVLGARCQQVALMAALLLPLCTFVRRQQVAESAARCHRQQHHERHCDGGHMARPPRAHTADHDVASLQAGRASGCARLVGALVRMCWLSVWWLDATLRDHHHVCASCRSACRQTCSASDVGLPVAMGCTNKSIARRMQAGGG